MSLQITFSQREFNFKSRKHFPHCSMIVTTAVGRCPVPSCPVESPHYTLHGVHSVVLIRVPLFLLPVVGFHNSEVAFHLELNHCKFFQVQLGYNRHSWKLPGTGRIEPVNAIIQGGNSEWTGMWKLLCSVNYCPWVWPCRTRLYFSCVLELPWYTSRILETTSIF